MIISQVIRSFNKSKPQQRLVLGLSSSDVVLSMTWALTPLFMPEESGQIWAVGNATSCTVQGFIITLFCLAGVLYQVTLQFQYLLVIKYGWTERRVRGIGLYLHAFPWGCGLASAITNLILKNFVSLSREKIMHMVNYHVCEYNYHFYLLLFYRIQRAGIVGLLHTHRIAQPLTKSIKVGRD
jgi:hypothetical protein